MQPIMTVVRSWMRPPNVVLQHVRHKSRLENNFVFRSLDFVHKVDKQHSELAQASSQAKAAKLMDVIADKPELLYLLALFHSECRKVGLLPENVAERRSSWRYGLSYVMRLRPIHETFWDMCRLSDVANHHHRLHYSVSDVGILDPQHFPVSVYDQMQRGRLGTVDFRDVETVLFTRPDFDRQHDKHDENV